MDEQSDVRKFDTLAGFEQQVRACIGRARHSLSMFDPDFAVIHLGESSMDELLRAFLHGGGSIRMAMHSTAHIERHYPRFLRLLKDYDHRIACRVTSRSLRQLTDSFVIGDGADIVRRYHSDHARGEAAFGQPEATDLSRERFEAIWEESTAALHPTTTGL